MFVFILLPSDLILCKILPFKFHLIETFYMQQAEVLYLLQPLKEFWRKYLSLFRCSKTSQQRYVGPRNCKHVTVTGTSYSNSSRKLTEKGVKFVHGCIISRVEEYV